MRQKDMNQITTDDNDGDDAEWNWGQKPAGVPNVSVKKMGKVQVNADVLVALIRTFKRAYENKLMDPDAVSHYSAVHQLEYTATRKLKEAKNSEKL